MGRTTLKLLFVLLVVAWQVGEVCAQHRGRLPRRNTHDGSFLGAAAVGDINVIRTFIERGVDVNVTTDGTSQTALMLTLRRTGDSTEITRLLLDAGADPTLQDWRGDSALHYAASGTNFRSLSLLLEQGIDPDVRGFENRTALHHATESGGNVFQSVEALIKAGASIDARDDNGWTPLLIASKSGWPFIVKTLTDSGADVSAHVEAGEFKGMTALHLAALEGVTDTIILLLQASADVTVKDSQGNTALHYAAGNDRSDHWKIKVLLNADAAVNVRNNRGETPLHFAVNAKYENDDAVARLLEAGADPSITDDAGTLPLHIACRQGRAEDVRALLRGGAKPNPVNAKRTTPLINALAFFDLPAHALKLNDGRDELDRPDQLAPWAQIIVRTIENSLNNQHAIVELLIESGADINLADGEGNSPLILAARYSDLQTVRSLLDGGAQPLHRNKNGLSALDYARKRDDEQGRAIVNELKPLQMPD